MRSPINALLDLAVYSLTWPGNNNQVQDPDDPETVELISDWIDELPKKDLEKLANTVTQSIKKYGAAWGDNEEMTEEQKKAAIQMMIQETQETN